MAETEEKKPIVDQKALKKYFKDAPLFAGENSNIKSVIDDEVIEAQVRSEIDERTDRFVGRVLYANTERIGHAIIKCLLTDRISDIITTEVRARTIDILKSSRLINSEGNLEYHVREDLFRAVRELHEERITEIFDEQGIQNMLQFARATLETEAKKYIEQDIPEVVGRQIGFMYDRMQEMDKEIRELKDSNYKIESIRTNLENHERRNSH